MKNKCGLYVIIHIRLFSITICNLLIDFPSYSGLRWDITLYFFLLTQNPPLGQRLLIHEVSRSHSTTHHSRQDSSGRVISPSQRPLPDNTQHSQQTDFPTPQRDSNLKSQQANDRRPTPETARPIGRASLCFRTKYIRRVMWLTTYSLSLP